MRILIATDGSPQSDTAIHLARQIQKLVAGSLTLLTVIKQESEHAQAEAILLRATTLLNEGMHAHTRIRTGSVAEEIVREVIEGNHDLVVLGDKEQHSLASRLLTPTVMRVINQLPCPVIVARGEVRPLRRVLVCESGRDPSLLNRLIERLAVLLNHADELTTLHVMSQIAAAPGVPGWELRAEAEELIEKQTNEGTLLEDDLAQLANLNVRLEAKVRHGLVVREILEEMQSGDYDLVVIGAHQGEGWERFLLDDLANELIRQADRTLLVV